MNEAADRRKRDSANGCQGSALMSLESVPSCKGVEDALATGLRAWGKGEAQRRGVPVFRIFSNLTLDALVAAKPTNEAQHLDVPGVAPVLAKKYGAKLIHIIRHAGS